MKYQAVVCEQTTFFVYAFFLVYKSLFAFGPSLFCFRKFRESGVIIYSELLLGRQVKNVSVGVVKILGRDYESFNTYCAYFIAVADSSVVLIAGFIRIFRYFPPVKFCKASLSKCRHVELTAQS